MRDVQDIQWYPGHMAKTRREIQAQLRNTDLVAEVADARAPLASRNPDIDALTRGKPRIIVLNKADLADPNVTARWVRRFAAEDIAAVPTDGRSGAGIRKFREAVSSAMARKLAADAGKSMRTKIRIMICGIPNVGKSALINRLAGAKKVRVEDRPGVTRGIQWISIGDGMELMDTAGVLWPKFSDPGAALLLAFTGAIKDNVLDVSGVALKLLEYLAENRPEALCSRYGLSPQELEAPGLLELICVKRGMLLRGGEPDHDRCAAMLLDELRAGKLGRISFEEP